MLNEAELNALKGLMHYLNAAPSKPVTRSEGQPAATVAHAGLSFDVNIVDSNGDVLGMIKHEGNEYNFYPGLKVS